MRPWLLLPVVLPGLWCAFTFGEVWPHGTPEFMSSPTLGASSALVGILLAMVCEQIRKRRPGGRLRSPWFSSPDQPAAPTDGDAPLDEPLITSRYEDVPLGRVRVEMPEPLSTATPAPVR